LSSFTNLLNSSLTRVNDAISRRSTGKILVHIQLFDIQMLYIQYLGTENVTDTFVFRTSEYERENKEVGSCNSAKTDDPHRSPSSAAQCTLFIMIEASLYDTNAGTLHNACKLSPKQ
jgi:hypothetical protein